MNHPERVSSKVVRLSEKDVTSLLKYIHHQRLKNKIMIPIPTSVGIQQLISLSKFPDGICGLVEFKS